MRRHVLTSLGCVILALSMVDLSEARAGGCSDYPYLANEVDLEETPAGPKLLATGAVSVDFDDTDEVLDASEEAEMKAKAAISAFLTDTIQSDKGIEEASQKITRLTSAAGGQKKTASKTKIKNTLKRLAGHTSALLRGVMKLAECYDKGQKVMVTVGIKPETIAAAEGMAGAIGDSVSRQPTPKGDGATGGAKPSSAGSADSQGASPSGPDSYNRGTDKLKDF